MLYNIKQLGNQQLKVMALVTLTLYMQKKEQFRCWTFLPFPILIQFQTVQKEAHLAPSLLY